MTEKPRSVFSRFVQQLESAENLEALKTVAKDFLKATEIQPTDASNPERLGRACSQAITRVIASAIAGENHTKVFVVTHKDIGPKRFGSDDNAGRLSGATAQIADVAARLGLCVDVVPANDTPADMILSWGSWTNEEDVRRFRNTVRAIETLNRSPTA